MKVNLTIDIPERCEKTYGDGGAVVVSERIVPATVISVRGSINPTDTDLFRLAQVLFTNSVASSERGTPREAGSQAKVLMQALRDAGLPGRKSDYNQDGD